MSLDALKADPQVGEAEKKYDAAMRRLWEIQRDDEGGAVDVMEYAVEQADEAWDALLAAVVAKTRERLAMDAIQMSDKRLQDLLARWTAWREAREAWMTRESFDVETEKALVSAGAKAEAALAAWNRRSA